MMFYIMLSAAAVLLIFALSLVFPLASPPMDPQAVLLTALFDAAAVFLIDAVLAFAIRRMPEKYFSGKSSLFRVSKGEMRLYSSLGLKKWKKYIPELGVFTGFSKSSLTRPRDPEYLRRFILESCYGIVIHIAGGVGGMIIMLFYPSGIRLRICLPIVLVNLLLNLLPTMLLRYNLPMLVRLYEHYGSEENGEREI